MCGIKQLSYSFLQFFLCHLFFSFFTPMCILTLNMFSSNSISKEKNLEEKIFWENFAGPFLTRQWSIYPFHFFVLFVHWTQILLSNFIKNPFCYFSISNSCSKRPITLITFKIVQKCLLNSSFWYKVLKQPVVSLKIFFSYLPVGWSGLAGPPVTISCKHFLSA